MPVNQGIFLQCLDVLMRHGLVHVLVGEELKMRFTSIFFSPATHNFQAIHIYCMHLLPDTLYHAVIDSTGHGRHYFHTSCPSVIPSLN